MVHANLKGHTGPGGVLLKDHGQCLALEVIVDESMLLANRILVFGQSPSNIIYDKKIPEDLKITRETIFENSKILELRNELINHINRDVADHTTIGQNG